MSINLVNPETVLGKVDAAANYVAQIRLASMVGDAEHATKSIAEAERHLFNAITQIEEEEEKASRPAMYNELAAHVATLQITGDNIGTIRRQLLMPFDCHWNGYVRDLTAQREVQCAEREKTKKQHSGEFREEDEL